MVFFAEYVLKKSSFKTELEDRYFFFPHLTSLLITNIIKGTLFLRESLHKQVLLRQTMGKK